MKNPIVKESVYGWDGWFKPRWKVLDADTAI